MNRLESNSAVGVCTGYEDCGCVHHEAWRASGHVVGELRPRLADGTAVSWLRYGKLCTGVITSSDERGAMCKETWVDPWTHNEKARWELVSWDRLESGQAAA